MNGGEGRYAEGKEELIFFCEPRFSPDGSLIVVGSDDACVDIYTTHGLSRVGYCRGIPSFVTHIDWSQDGKYLQVCICVWRRELYQLCEIVRGTEVYSWEDL